MPIQQTMFILSVYHIEAARRFYRDVVGLGEPKLDSNFWVEFALSETCSFCLEQKKSPEDGGPAGKVTCLFRVPDINAFRQRYESAGFTSSRGDIYSIFGENAYSFQDSEGNTIYITDADHA